MQASTLRADSAAASQAASVVPAPTLTALSRLAREQLDAFRRTLGTLRGRIEHFPISAEDIAADELVCAAQAFTACDTLAGRIDAILPTLT